MQTCTTCEYRLCDHVILQLPPTLLATAGNVWPKLISVEVAIATALRHLEKLLRYRLHIDNIYTSHHVLYSSTLTHCTAGIGKMNSCMLKVLEGAIFRSAFIKHKLSNFTTAVAEYSTVLEMDKNYFVALKGYRNNFVILHIYIMHFLL